MIACSHLFTETIGCPRGDDTDSQEWGSSELTCHLDITRVIPDDECRIARFYDLPRIFVPEEYRTFRRDILILPCLIKRKTIPNYLCLFSEEATSSEYGFDHLRDPGGDYSDRMSLIRSILEEFVYPATELQELDGTG